MTARATKCRVASQLRLSFLTIKIGTNTLARPRVDDIPRPPGAGLTALDKAYMVWVCAKIPCRLSLPSHCSRNHRAIDRELGQPWPPCVIRRLQAMALPPLARAGAASRLLGTLL